MHGNSPEVTSNQQGCHDQLELIVRKHLDHEFKKPYADFNLQAFAHAQDFIKKCGEHKSIILDSGCGVGETGLFSFTTDTTSPSF